jgi:hypothetical protein
MASGSLKQYALTLLKTEPNEAIYASNIIICKYSKHRKAANPLTTTPALFGWFP